MTYTKAADEQQHARAKEAAGFHLSLRILHRKPQPDGDCNANRRHDDHLAAGPDCRLCRRLALQQGYGTGLAKFADREPNGKDRHK